MGNNPLKVIEPKKTAQVVLEELIKIIEKAEQRSALAYGAESFNSWILNVQSVAYCNIKQYLRENSYLTDKQ